MGLFAVFAEEKGSNYSLKELDAFRQNALLIAAPIHRESMVKTEQNLLSMAFS